MAVSLGTGSGLSRKQLRTRAKQTRRQANMKLREQRKLAKANKARRAKNKGKLNLSDQDLTQLNSRDSLKAGSTKAKAIGNKLEFGKQAQKATRKAIRAQKKLAANAAREARKAKKAAAKAMRQQTRANKKARKLAGRVKAKQARQAKRQARKEKASALRSALKALKPQKAGKAARLQNIQQLKKAKRPEDRKVTQAAGSVGQMGKASGEEDKAEGVAAAAQDPKTAAAKQQKSMSNALDSIISGDGQAVGSAVDDIVNRAATDALMQQMETKDSDNEEAEEQQENTEKAQEKKEAATAQESKVQAKQEQEEEIREVDTSAEHGVTGKGGAMGRAPATKARQDEDKQPEKYERKTEMSLDIQA